MRSPLSRDRVAARVESVIAARGPEHGRRILYGKDEAARHHTDHGVTHVIERRGPPDNVAGRAKRRLPQIMAEHDDVRARLLVFQRDAPSHSRGNSENAEEVAGDNLTAQVFGVASAGQGEAVIVERGQAVEGVALRSPVKEVGVADGPHTPRRGPTIVHRSRRDQTVRLGEGQGPEQHRVHQTKDCCRGANSQPDRQNRGEGKSGRLGNLAKRKTKVLPQVQHAVLRHSIWYCECTLPTIVSGQSSITCPVAATTSRSHANSNVRYWTVTRQIVIPMPWFLREAKACRVTQQFQVVYLCSHCHERKC